MKKYFKQLKANKRGFTLIEMIVVIAIIGILAAILVPSMAGYLSTAKESKKEANAKTVYTAAQVAVTSLEATDPLDRNEKTYLASKNKEEKNTGYKLFTKIESFIGESNYDKFDEIKVTVADGAVKSVEVTEKGAAKKDAVTYPK